METAWIVFNNDAGALPIHHLNMEAAWVMFNKMLVLFQTQLPLHHLSLICKVCDRTICLHLKYSQLLAAILVASKMQLPIT
jgi:hypothetical protein